MFGQIFIMLAFFSFFFSIYMFFSSIEGKAAESFSGLWGNAGFTFNSTNGDLEVYNLGLDLGNAYPSEPNPWEYNSYQKRVDSNLIRKITFKSKVYAPEDSSRFFSTLDGKGLPNLSDIEGLQFLDTSNTTNMTRMFDKAVSLKSLNLDSFDTHKVNNMNAMFANDRSLSNLSLSNFMTSSVTDMSGMFYDTPKLKKIDLSSFDTSRTTTMVNMFLNDTDDKELQTLNLSNFNFSNVSNKAGMFFGEKKLSKLSLPSSFYDPKNTVSLPEIQSNDQFTGNWKKENGGTVGTTSQFLADYNSNSAGTYVWEDKVDPLVPDDPNQNELVLRHVPNEFRFQTKLSIQNYQVEAKLTNENVSVYNDRKDRDWSLKAVLDQNKLIGENQSVFNVQQFKINEINLIGTGFSGIISKAPDIKTLQNNVGNLTKEINNISISFSDDKLNLKANESLQGQIIFQLYNTLTAE